MGNRQKKASGAVTIDELQNIDPDSYVKGVEEGKRSAIPSVEKQSEIIAQIDKLLKNMHDQITTLETMRTCLIVQWLVKGDEKEFQRVMVAEKWGESCFKHAKQRAQRYFKTVIEAFRMGQHLGDGTTRVKP